MRNLLILISLIFIPSTTAQIVTDGTVGSATAGPVPQVGPAYTIDANLGLQSGTNLFHSFSQFNIRIHETATFTGPDLITNIISRVTGGQNSTINGRLTSTINQADLILINPAGIVFGPHADINVNGAFSVSTADYVRFDDGTFYNGTPSSPSFPGTPASLSAFGFLSDDPSSITINGGKINGDGELSVIGGDINVVNGKIEATGGKINLISTRSGGEVTVANNNGEDPFDINAFEALGTIFIRNEAPEPMQMTREGGMGMMGNMGDQQGDIRRETVAPTAGIQVDGDPEGTIPAGEITIATGHLEISNGASLFASSVTGDAGTITVRANSIRMNGQGLTDFTGISAQTTEPATTGAGNMNGMMGGMVISTGGNVVIETGSLEILNGAEINASTETNVPAGKIEVTATTVLIDSQGGAQQTGLISETQAETTGGPGGNISIAATDLTIEGTNATVTTDSSGAARGGNISINSDALEITNGGVIQANTQGSGNGGMITVNATSIRLNGNNMGTTGISAESVEQDATGNGGNIEISSGTIEIYRGAEINATTRGSGNGGRISLFATGSVVIDSIGGMTRTGVIAESRRTTGAGGKGGNISITTDVLKVRHESSFISATTFGTGNGGNITILANSVLFDRVESSNANGMQGPGFTGIVAETLSEMTSAGTGGRVDIDANTVGIRNGALINTNTHGDGRGGNIELDMNVLELSAGSAILSESLSSMGGGDSGAVSINATDTVRILNQSSIKTSSRDAGGGKITVNARELVYLGTSEISTSAQGSQAGDRAGDISIDPVNVVLNNSRIIANAFGGNGGNIDIQTRNFIQSNNSIVEASSALRNDGQIKVTSPDADVSAGLVALHTNFIDAADWIVARCALRSSENISSFIVTGRGGVPPAPDDLQTSFSLAAFHDINKSSATSTEERSVRRTLPFKVDAYKTDNAPCFDCE